MELPPPKDCVDVNEDDDDDEDIEEEPPAASRDLNTPSPPSEQDLNPFFHDDPNFDAVSSNLDCCFFSIMNSNCHYEGIKYTLN